MDVRGLPGGGDAPMSPKGEEAQPQPSVEGGEDAPMSPKGEEAQPQPEVFQAHRL
jgi:hypothetical protein